MAYRIPVNLHVDPANLGAIRRSLPDIAQPLIEDALGVVKEWYVQNLSGVPFTSESGTHVINKRTGRGAASVQVQTPYGSPFRGRLFAGVNTSYADNPEVYNYLKILEEGRGEVWPKYTPSMRAGRPDRARLAIPVGSHELVFGQKGFRGSTGRYRFVRYLKAQGPKYPLKAAIASAQEDIQNVTSYHLGRALNADS